MCGLKTVLGEADFPQLKLAKLPANLYLGCRTILDQAETRQDFWQLVSRHCQQHIASGQAKFCLIKASP